MTTRKTNALFNTRTDAALSAREAERSASRRADALLRAAAAEPKDFEGPKRPRRKHRKDASNRS